MNRCGKTFLQDAKLMGSGSALFGSQMLSTKGQAAFKMRATWAMIVSDNFEGY